MPYIFFSKKKGTVVRKLLNLVLLVLYFRTVCIVSTVLKGLDVKKKGEMSKLNDEIKDLTRQLSRNKLISISETAEDRARRRKLNELRRRLLAYEGRIFGNNAVSITLTHYESALLYDPELLILIQDLNFKIQFSIL